MITKVIDSVTGEVIFEIQGELTLAFPRTKLIYEDKTYLVEYVERLYKYSTFNENIVENGVKVYVIEQK